MYDRKLEIVLSKDEKQKIQKPCLFTRVFNDIQINKQRLLWHWNDITMVQNRKKHRINSHLIIHFPTSEGVSKVSERANEWAQRSARAKRVGRSKQTNERYERTSERTSEWPSTYIWVLGWSGPKCTKKRRLSKCHEGKWDGTECQAWTGNLARTRWHFGHFTGVGGIPKRNGAEQWTRSRGSIGCSLICCQNTGSEWWRKRKLKASNAQPWVRCE